MTLKLQNEHNIGGWLNLEMFGIEKFTSTTSNALETSTIPKLWEVSCDFVDPSGRDGLNIDFYGAPENWFNFKNSEHVSVPKFRNSFDFHEIQDILFGREIKRKKNFLFSNFNLMRKHKKYF